MLYLHIYDDSKRPTPTKLTEACAAYRERFHTSPTLILVNEADAGASCPGCEVRAEKRVGPCNYQVGKQEGS